MWQTSGSPYLGGRFCFLGGEHVELSAKNLYALFERHKKILNPFAVVCQCRHETMYRGKVWSSELCLKANNLAGLKKWPGWLGPFYSKNSWEQKPDGTKYEKVSEFCRYASVEGFVANYATKIERDYPLCAASADNFWGYFSGLFKGRVGAWATDLAYLDRMVDQVLIIGSVFFGADWAQKCWDALEYAAAKKRLQPGHEERIRQRLGAAIPLSIPLWDGPASAKSPSTGKLICLDPGHGDPDPGAVGKGGTKEAVVTLRVAELIAGELERAGYRAMLTRSTSKRLLANYKADLNKRPKLANDAGANCFVSIHCNSATNSTSQGFEAYTTPGQNNSDKLATCIIEAWRREIGGVLRTDMSDGDPDKEANFAVIRGTKSPSCLVELAFISNPAEEKKLADPTWQKKAAATITRGIASYLG